MSLRRRLDWSTSMRDIRAEAPANRFAARLVVNGKIDKAALMRRAVATARSLRAGGKSWAWRMSVGLRSAARAAMAAPGLRLAA